MVTPGDFNNRKMDTRTKKRATKSDIKSVNKSFSEVMVSQNNAINPSENPFGFLWLVNCAFYSVVVAFLIQKGWKKNWNARNVTAKSEEKMKEKYEAQAGEIRKNISIAKA